MPSSCAFNFRFFFTGSWLAMGLGSQFVSSWLLERSLGCREYCTHETGWGMNGEPKCWSFFFLQLCQRLRRDCNHFFWGNVQLKSEIFQEFVFFLPKRDLFIKIRFFSAKHWFRSRDFEFLPHNLPLSHKLGSSFAWFSLPRGRLAP